MAPPGVNAFYAISFTTIDPILSLIAIYTNYINPQMVLDPAFPRDSALSTITPAVTFLNHLAGGSFAMFAFLMIFMLRATNELKVWKLFQCGLLFTDAAVLYGQWRAAEVQGGVWSSDAIYNAAIVGVITAVRLSFVLGIGVGGEKVGKKRN